MPEIPKAYLPGDVERAWFARWTEAKCFHADEHSAKPAYSIVIPPPNVTGVLHLGHVLNNTLQDILARRARMQGKEVLWLPGTDHAGIATQTVVERTLKKQGLIKHRDDLGREKFLEKIWEWKEKHGGIIIEQLKRLGCSCDWERERFTMDADYTRCVQQVFVDLYKKGLIYRGKRMVNWCPVSLTALSDEEVIMKPQNGLLYYFQVEVMDEPTRPRAVDMSEAEEQTLSHEHTTRDTRTGRQSYISGPRFDERSGAALSASNRRRVGQAQALLGIFAGRGASEEVGQDGQSKFRTLLEFCREIGLPVVSHAELGLKCSSTGALVPTRGDLVPFKPGAEAQPFGDLEGGLVYKFFAANEEGKIGKKICAYRTKEGTWEIDFEPASTLESLEKLALLHEIGGLPTEIVGITPTNEWIIKQPLATHIGEDEILPRRGEAVANAGGVQVQAPKLGDIRVVWHRGQAWIIGDLHVKNVMKDAEGKMRIMDALICPVPPAMLRELPAMQSAVREAKILAGEVDEAGRQEDLFGDANRAKTVLNIATTRPETIPGDSGIAVSPKDPRYAHLIGRRVRRPLPLENQAAIPIVADDHIDPEFGTGVLKVTPAHDKADFEIGQRHGLEAIDVLSPQGVMDELAGKDLAGLDRFEARKKAAELLRESGALIKEEPYTNNVGYSERADVPIEPRLSEQWFLKYPSQEKSRNVVASGQMKFYPERWAKVYDHWMGNLQDWCISRQLWWGHRVPVWYRKDSTPGEGVWCDTEPPPDAENWTQDSDVLDTWCSSWLWPFATMGWPESTDTLRKFYPTSDLVTGPDIIFFWVARMIMAGYEYMGDLPFRNVYFTSIIRDKQGRKMSKSLGNSPDPLDLIDKYGADGLRFGLLRIAPTGTDVKFDEKQIEEGRNFANKLWNACRYRQMQGGTSTGLETSQCGIYALDILAKLDQLQVDLESAYKDYEFNRAAQLLYDFFWGNYCDLYLETIKGDASPSTLATQDAVLRRFLMLLHPFMPHITEELWRTLGFGKEDEFLMLTTLSNEPVLAGLDPARVREAQTRAAMVFDAAAQIRNLKAEYGLATNREVKFRLRPAADWITSETTVLRLLTGAAEFQTSMEFEGPSGTPTIVTKLGEVLMPLAGLIDVEKERERLAKELAKIDGDLEKTEASLTRFNENTPEAVISKTTIRLQELKEKRAKIDRMTAALG